MGWAAAAASGGADIAQGVMGDEMAQGQANQYEFNARSEGIAADQAEAQRRQQLLNTLGQVDAVRTSRGLDVASPTGMALQQYATTSADRNIATERLNYLTQQGSDDIAAQDAQISGDMKLLGGFIGAGQQGFDYGQTQGWFGG